MRTPRLGGAVTIAAALVLTGCGTTDSGRNAQTGTSTPNAQDQGVAYARCMRENGVKMPDPDPDRPGAVIIPKPGNTAALQAAMKACRQYLPVKAQEKMGGSEDMDRMVAIARCLRGKGVDAPDPQPGQGLTIRDRLNDPEVQQALLACRKSSSGGAG
ncbi:hypothetical protein ABZ470_28560 [Streptosporangium sp. NPDC020072]|uniref:hypothetical protein n=1 Tax=Streptosporangium sp. NPDC020072 TaxID=3154788 RepID=UPI0034360105